MRNAARRLLKIDFVRFCLVGASGFVINAVLLTLLIKGLHSPFVAQFIAAEVALFSNFMFHNRWTYRANQTRKTITKLIVQFHATSWVAIAGSVGIVGVLVSFFGVHHIIALVVSSAAALFWNFGWSKYAIWRHRPAKNDPEGAETSPAP